MCSGGGQEGGGAVSGTRHAHSTSAIPLRCDAAAPRFYVTIMSSSSSSSLSSRRGVSGRCVCGGAGVLLILFTLSGYLISGGSRIPAPQLVAHPAPYVAAPPLPPRTVPGLSELHVAGMRRRLPGAIIIGVRKGGTRALLEFLGVHPNVCAKRSEMHFFDYEDNFTNGLEWYRRQMPYSYPDQVTLEKTPAYFVEPDVPDRVFRLLPRVKLLLIVRDPVTRTISDYAQVRENKLARGKPYRSFEELVIDPATREVNVSYKPIRRSIYHRHLERWLQVFPREQLMIVDGDAFIHDPLPQLHAVETFLGLQRRLTTHNLYYNATRGFFCIRNETQERCLSDSKGRPHPPVRQEVISQLRTFFKNHNSKFFEMAGKQFPWH